MTRRLPLALAFGLSVALAAQSAQAQQVNHGAGFTGQTDMQLNGGASINGSFLQITNVLTPGVSQGRSAYYNTKLPVGNFQTTFTFHITVDATGFADGFGFLIQNQALTQVGAVGGGMGYAGITPSLFIKFDIYPNVSTTELCQAGTGQDDANSTPLAPVDLHSQHDMRCVMTYDGTTLTVTTTDLNNNNTSTQSYTVDIPTVVAGATAWVGFCGGTGGEDATQEILTWTYSSLPAPTGLVVTPGFNSNVLTWNAVAGATAYNIYRAPTAAGPFVAPPLATVNAPTTTYTDTTVTYPNTYFYVVQAVQGPVTSLNSNPPVQGTPLQPPVTATPNTGLQTNEGGASSSFTISYNIAQGAASTLTVTSSNLAEGTVAAQGLTTTPVPGGFSFVVPAGQTPTITVIVTGVDDFIIDGNIAYQINVTASGVAVPIPPVQCTNMDDDIQGLTFSRTAGLVTSESGGQATFTVVLNRQPFGNVSFTLASSNVLEGTVAPALLTFTNGAVVGDPNAWNAAHLVTVTGVDDTLLDFTVPYAIVTGGLTFANPQDLAAFNAAGVTAVPDVACSNLDNEVPPALDTVWGGAGCGLLGAEIALPLLLVGLLRRRRRTA